MKLSQVAWATVGKAVVKGYTADDVPGLASEMAYSFIFALFPAAIFLSTLTGLVARLTGTGTLFAQIMATLYRTVPPASAQALEGPLDEVLNQQPVGLSLGAVLGAGLTLWLASNGVATIMKAFNRAYGVEETRGFVARRLLALLLTLVLSSLLSGGFVLLLFGDQLGRWLAARYGFAWAFGAGWLVTRLVLALLGISFGLALLYWQGPNVRQQFRWISPGSVLTAGAWVLMTGGFGFYVRVLGASSYSKYYGTLVGLALFLFYLYLTSTVLLLGAELNAEMTKRYDPATIRDKMEDPRKQLPGKQPRPAPQAAAEAGVTLREVAESNVASAAQRVAGEGDPATPTAPERAARGEG